jgi:hypothetical protein
MPEKNELKIVLSDKAKKLLEEFKIGTGYNDDSRIIEEALFTISELIEVAKTRDKSRTEIPADRFIGIIGTFTRFTKAGY